VYGRLRQNRTQPQIWGLRRQIPEEQIHGRKGEENKMFTSHNQFLSILTGAVAGALITFGLVSFRSAATPVQAQTQPTTTATAPATGASTVSPTPFDPGPEVEGGEVGEGISREGGVFINDLASKLNVPVSTLESDISGSFNMAVNQAVQQGFVNQTDANQIAAREANLFTSGSGFIFDIDEFPGSNVVIPVTGATLTPTATSTEEEVTATPSEDEENDKDENSKIESKEEEKEESVKTEQVEDGEQHEVSPTVTPTLEVSPSASPTPLPSKTPRPTEIPRSTLTPRPSSTPSSDNNASATPLLSMTPTPTMEPTQPEDFSLFYTP
jgi:hypothetical protein